MLYNFFNEFDSKYKNKKEYINTNISEHLKENLNLKIKNEKNEKNENYYKAKLIYALTKSKFYNENLFCSEVIFLKEISLALT